MIEPTDEMVQAFYEADRLKPGDIRNSLAAALAMVEQNHVAPLLNLIRDLTDRDECWYDHNGGCQAHGYLSLGPTEACPHAEAKEILAREGIDL